MLADQELAVINPDVIHRTAGKPPGTAAGQPGRGRSVLPSGRHRCARWCRLPSGVCCRSRRSWRPAASPAQFAALQLHAPAMITLASSARDLPRPGESTAVIRSDIGPEDHDRRVRRCFDSHSRRHDRTFAVRSVRWRPFSLERRRARRAEQYARRRSGWRRAHWPGGSFPLRWRRAPGCLAHSASSAVYCATSRSVFDAAKAADARVDLLPPPGGRLDAAAQHVDLGPAPAQKPVVEVGRPLRQRVDQTAAALDVCPEASSASAALEATIVA